LPRELTVATPSALISTWSSKPANPPVRLTVNGRPTPTGVDCVTDGIVGAVGVGDAGGGLPALPDSSPHPVSTSPAAAVMAATAAYLLRFLTHHGYR
jgi:hypothetical protein